MPIPPGMGTSRHVCTPAIFHRCFFAFVCGAKAGLFKPRPETVALSATEKHEMRIWGLDVDAVTRPDSTKPPPWVKASTEVYSERQQRPYGRLSVGLVEPEQLCLHTRDIGVFSGLKILRTLHLAAGGHAGCCRSCLKAMSNPLANRIAAWRINLFVTRFIPTQAVGNTTSKWANKELGIRAAREEQEFVEKLRETSPSRLLSLRART